MDGSSGGWNISPAQSFKLAELGTARPGTRRLYTGAGLLFSCSGSWPEVFPAPRNAQGS